MPSTPRVAQGGTAVAATARRDGERCELLETGLSSVLFDTPRRLTDVGSWHEHIPFAFLAVELLKPRVFVELGVHRGDSYCAFCQAVDRLALETRCYGVDTWRGDLHAGWYGDDVLVELRAHHDTIYGRFSRLVQSTFDEAVAYFPDSSVDL